MNSTTSDHIRFARNLVKGKIAETIFAQMMRETKAFTVLEFGYEKLVPELVQSGYDEGNGLIETLRTAPDFAVIDKSKNKVQLIEVKYQHVLNKTHVLKAVTRMHTSWNPSYLFVATLDGFYFDEINTILKNNGNISPMEFPAISVAMQDRYLQILRDFEMKNSTSLPPHPASSSLHV